EFASKISGRERYLLPNKLAITHLNKNETDFLYKEVFEVKAYYKHDISIKPGDCVFDVGANIGLFTLFAHQQGARVYSFEPNPYVYEIMKLNSQLYRVVGEQMQCGLSREEKQTKFTFYPQFSFLSGLYADLAEDKELVRSFIRNEQREMAGRDEELLEELLADR